MNSYTKNLMDEREKSKLRDEINANLKRVYSQALKEEVPDTLNKLLEKLRQQEGKQ